MRYISLSFRSPAELTAAAGIVARRYPSIEAEAGETCLHLYCDEDRPLWGEILVALRAEGIRPVRPRPTWAGRLAALARRRGLDAIAEGETVCLATGDAGAVVALSEAASRRGLAFSVRPYGGAGEYDPRICLRLMPGAFDLDALLRALEVERRRIEKEIWRWRS